LLANIHITIIIIEIKYDDDDDDAIASNKPRDAAQPITTFIDLSALL